MTASSKGPIVGIVLLLVVVGAVVGTMTFLKSPSGDETVDTSPVVVSDGTPDTERQLDPTRLPSTEPQRSETGTNITVVCMGPGGAADPLAGIEIVATPTSGAVTKRKAAVTMATDAAGKAVFADLEFKAYSIAASPEQYYPLRVYGVRDGAHVPLVFQEGIPITGVVKNTAGETLSDVFVRVRSGLDGELIGHKIQQAMSRGQDVQDVEGAGQPQPHLTVDTRTDAEGRFQFPVIPKNYRVKLGIFHDDYDPFEQDLITMRVDAIDGEYILIPRTEIFGRVVDDQTDEVVEGVLVQATEGGVPVEVIAQLGGGAELFECVSGADGSYRLTGVPRGQQNVQVTHPGYNKYQNVWQLTDLEPFELEIRLLRAASLAGRVVDTTGRPIEGATCHWVYPETLVLGPRALMAQQGVTTGADGRFGFADCPVERPFTILVQHPNYVEARNENVLLQAGESLAGIEVVMTSGGSISGVVKTSAQRPVQGATLTARSVNPPGPALNSVVSGPDGSYTVYNTMPGTYEVTCEAEGFCTLTNRNVADVSTGVSFFLVQEAIFKGTVVDQDGNAIERYRLRTRTSGTQQALATTTIREEEGTFELTGMNPGQWDIEITADGFAPTILDAIVLKEGETTDAGVLSMTQGASAAGRVTGVNGRPVASALIRFEQIDRFNKADKTYIHLQARTDSNGDFTVPNLVAGEYEVIATHPRYAQPKPIPFTIRDGPVTRTDITLQRPAKLRLIVRDVDGNTVPGAKVSLFRGSSPLADSERVVTMPGATGLKLPEGNRKSGMLAMSDADSNLSGWNIPTDRNGELTWTRKLPGEWGLWVTAAGFYKYTARLTLLVGKEVVHEAIMEPLAEGDDPRGKKGGKGRDKKRDRKNKDNGADDGR